MTGIRLEAHVELIPPDLRGWWHRYTVRVVARADLPGQRRDGEVVGSTYIGRTRSLGYAEWLAADAVREQTAALNRRDPPPVAVIHPTDPTVRP